jgi:Putative prokaryotic signal transducing protein
MGRWSTFVARARAVLASFMPAGGRRPVPADALAGRSLVEIAADLPLPLGEMYCDLLRQAGIPALLRDEGAGRGALGGALLNVRLLVPADHADRARAVLRPDGPAAGSRNGDRRAQQGEDGA